MGDNASLHKGASSRGNLSRQDDDDDGEKRRRKRIERREGGKSARKIRQSRE